MKCPVCKDIELLMAERQGVEIDYCPTCRGVGLDRGELDKIVERSVSDIPGFSNQPDIDYHDEQGDGYGRYPRSWSFSAPCPT